MPWLWFSFPLSHTHIFFVSSSKHSRKYTLIKLCVAWREHRGKSLASYAAKRKSANIQMKLCRQAERENHSRCFFPSIRIKLTRLSIFSPSLLSRSLSFCFSFDYCCISDTHEPFSSVGSETIIMSEKGWFWSFFSLLLKILF